MAKIQISESELRQIIRESVENVLKEDGLWNGRPVPEQPKREPIVPAPKKRQLKIQDGKPENLGPRKLPTEKPAMGNPINHLPKRTDNGKLPVEKPEIVRF